MSWFMRAFWSLSDTYVRCESIGILKISIEEGNVFLNTIFSARQLVPYKPPFLTDSLASFSGNVLYRAFTALLFFLLSALILFRCSRLEIFSAITSLFFVSVIVLASKST